MNNKFIYEAQTDSVSEIKKGDYVKILKTQSYCNGDIVAVASVKDISVLFFKRAQDLTPGDIIVIGIVKGIIKP